ncbi:MAG: ribosome biogenesis GTP-binding protein YihA/YsxC [Candidatus Arsenophonus melophagi]|nr:ribosome biogenesis GTP-binding protein YihA/YsxC [Candidatus Arsenophonus melophagi]
MKKKYNYRLAKFFISVPDIDQLPNDHGIEIAFLGRSNAGKSSALNAITQQKNLAYTSKNPGRTQLITLFEIEKGIRLVDLPGYGYARVSALIKHQCQTALSEYLQKRKCLKGLIISMDIRNPLNNMDIQIITWAIAKNIPILVLLTKADKLVKNKRKTQVIAVNNRLRTMVGNIPVEMFSSFKKIGICKIQLKLDNWLNQLHSLNQ